MSCCFLDTPPEHRAPEAGSWGITSAFGCMLTPSNHWGDLWEEWGSKYTSSDLDAHGLIVQCQKRERTHHMSSSSAGFPKGPCQLFPRKKATALWSQVAGGVSLPAGRGRGRPQRGPWVAGGEPLAEHSTWFWTRAPIGWHSALSLPT